MCRLLCLQVYDSKEDTNNDENIQHGGEIKFFVSEVRMLCRDSEHNSEIWIHRYGTSENVLLEDIDISGGMKEGEEKRERTFTRLLSLT